MILLDYIRLIILIMPFGIFITFGLLVVVILSLRHAKLEEIFKRILFFYCLSASITSFFLLTYYYRPFIFERFDILYCASAILTIVLFHHMLCYMIRFDKPFNKQHYISVVFVCAIMLACKFVFPSFWAEEGTRTLMLLILIFGIVHSLMSLVRLYDHQIKLSLQRNTPEVIDKSIAIPFIIEILLFPWVFAVCPLITGQNPNVFTSLVLMASIVLALRMNIPLTYSMMRHYATPFNDISLLANDLSRLDVGDTNQQCVAHEDISSSTIVKPENECLVEQINSLPVIEMESQSPKRIYRKYNDNNIRKGILIEIDKKEFERYFRKHKPYLNPDLTIYDLVEFLQSNRTYLSKFINRVYKMNFNSYINHWRLREMERLLILPENKGKTTNQLFKQAGFSAHRTYLRAKNMEEESKSKKNNNK